MDEHGWVVATGEFDCTSHDILQLALTQATTRWQETVLDLGAVDFIDARAAAILVWHERTATDQGKLLRIVNATGVVERILDLITGDGKLFDG